MDVNLQLKCVVVGAAGVGKTSLLRRWTGRRPLVPHVPTTGVTSYLCHFLVQHPLRVRVELLFQDAGGEQLEVPTKLVAFLRDAATVILVYDVTKPETLAKLTSWLPAVMAATQPNAAVTLLGNKTDLMAQVTAVERKAFLREMRTHNTSGRFIWAGCTSARTAEDGPVQKSLEATVVSLYRAHKLDLGLDLDLKVVSVPRLKGKRMCCAVM